MVKINIILCLIVVFAAMSVGSAQNITKVLAGDPSFSTLNKLLSETGVAEEINTRKSLTLLAPDNSVLDPIVAELGPNLSKEQMADILRYHVLLQYFDIPELHQIVAKGTTEVTTLYQTTGRAEGTVGFVNVTTTKAGGLEVIAPGTGVSTHATIVKSVKQIPYNMSIFELSSVIVPQGVLTESTPPAAAPAPAPIKAPSPAPELAPFSAPSLSPVPASAPASSPASSPAPEAAPTPAPEAAPTPAPEAAPVPSAIPVPSPAISPMVSPSAGPPAPPAEGPVSPTAESPSAPSKDSASRTSTSALLLPLSLLLLLLCRI